MNKKILIWINCYGPWTPEFRRPIETIGYDQYLDGVVKGIRSLKDQVVDCYLSGGMHDELDRTECDTVKPELERRLDIHDIKADIKTDTDSLTSAMIMENFLTTWKNNYANYLPILFVDKVRYEINCYTLEYYCKKLGIENLSAREVVVPIERLDDHPNSTPEMQAKKLELMKEKGVEEIDSIEKEARTNNPKVA